MNRNQATLHLGIALAALTALLLAPMTGASDNEDYLTAEEYIELARPYLHMSCETAWAAVDEDPDAYVEIINKMSAIGFLNHDFDVEKLGELPPAELEERQVDFYNAVGELCRENPRNLLVGIVEEALVDAFLEIQPDAAEE